MFTENYRTAMLIVTGLIACATGRAAVRQPPDRTPVSWHATQRGAYETEWRSTTVVTNPITRKVQADSHRFVELAAGLNYRDRTGAFQPANPAFKLTPNGAEVIESAHRVVLT